MFNETYYVKYLFVGNNDLIGAYSGLVLNAVHGIINVRHVLISDDVENCLEDIKFLGDLNTYEKIYTTRKEVADLKLKDTEIIYDKEFIHLMDDIQNVVYRERVKTFMENSRVSESDNNISFNDTKLAIRLLEDKIIDANKNLTEIDYVGVQYDVAELLSIDSKFSLKAINSASIYDRFRDLQDKKHDLLRDINDKYYVHNDVKSTQPVFIFIENLNTTKLDELMLYTNLLNNISPNLITGNVIIILQNDNNKLATYWNLLQENSNKDKTFKVVKKEEDKPFKSDDDLIKSILANKTKESSGIVPFI